METKDHRLKELLATWRDVEASAGFEDRVRRRILTAEEKPRRPTLLEWITESLGEEPVWLPAMSAAAGVILGIFVVYPSFQPKPSMPGSLQAMNVGTLSGDYVRLVTGGSR